MMLRAARDGDRDAIIGLLETESLPTSDLSSESLEHFIVAEVDGVLAGCIGVEMLGSSALLRSLVVDPSARRGGLAGRLVEALEAKLANHGVADIWLLTIDASEFFLRHRYAVRQREEAPDRIRQTAEFSSLCPGSAILMCKQAALA